MVNLNPVCRPGVIERGLDSGEGGLLQKATAPPSSRPRLCSYFPPYSLPFSPAGCGLLAAVGSLGS
jgi:hypothetical protein